MDKLAIKVEHVSKEYRLGAIGGGSLRGDIQSWMAKRAGKEDPNSKIGDEHAGNRGDRFLALNDVSFEVKKGEALGIIGHNGAGKSTLLKLLCRVTAPTKGKLSYNGRIASMLEVGTGFHPELTGRENVYMNGAILGMTKAEIAAKFNDIVTFAEMEQFIDTPVKRYSSGMYVKLAFSVAAHLDSEIMIMDEVLAVGDMNFQKKCIKKMSDAARLDGRTVLYVSHNMSTIRQLCNRCIVLEKGRVKFEGSVENAISTYLNNDFIEKTRIDLSKISRLDFLKREDVRLLFAEYVNGTAGIFQKRENIKLKLKWINNADIHNIGLRLVIYDSMGDHLCAMFNYDFYSGQRGKRVEAVLDMNVSSLAPGYYQSYYVFYYCNEFGGTEDIDQVRGLDFIIDDSTEHGILKWRTKAWGHIELPSPKIVSIREE